MFLVSIISATITGCPEETGLSHRSRFASWHSCGWWVALPERGKCGNWMMWYSWLPCRWCRWNQYHLDVGEVVIGNNRCTSGLLCSNNIAWSLLGWRLWDNINLQLSFRSCIDSWHFFCLVAWVWHWNWYSEVNDSNFLLGWNHLFIVR